MTQAADTQLTRSQTSDLPRNIAIVLGMAFYWSMADITRVDYFISLQAGLSSGVWAAFAAYCAVAVASIVVLFAKRAHVEKLLDEKRWLVPALSLGASLGAALLLAPLQGSSPALWAARLCTSAVPIFWFIIVTFAWGRTIIRESARRGMGIAVLSFAVGIAITFCSMLPNPLGNAVIVFTPFATSVLWWLASGTGEEPPASNRVADLENAQIPTFVICGLFLCGAGFAHDFANYSDSLSITSPFTQASALLTSLTCAALLSVALLISSRSSNADRMFIVAWSTLALAFFGCLFAAALEMFARPQQAGSIMGAIFMGFKLLLWIFTTNVARNSQISSTTAFGVLYLPLNMFMLIVIGTALPVMLQFGDAAVATYAQEILLALAFVLIAAAFVFFIRYAPTITEAVLDSAKSTSNYETLSQVARECGLTARETEIALLVSQGYSAKTIAEMLYVSPETIRTHTKRIYRKLGVHSKDDVIKLANPHKTP